MILLVVFIIVGGILIYKNQDKINYNRLYINSLEIDGRLAEYKFRPEIKTEGIIRKFERILYHYSNGKINSYPGELDNYMHLNIPVVKDSNEINGDILKEIYNLVKRETFDLDR